MSKQVKVKILSNDVREISLMGETITSEVLTRFTAGKVYPAVLLEEGEPLPFGMTALAPTLLLVNDLGDPADVIYQGPELELVEE